jgi:hypothetical protein
VQLAQSFADMAKAQIYPNYTALNKKIAELQRVYMKAQMEMQQGKVLYPDANSTLRFSFGQVKGYEPRDAVAYHFISTLDGVMDKKDPNNDEFEVPAKLEELYKKKDYGRYGEGNMMPVNFIAGNHTTGGNSGSPELNAKGELIGLNFDTVWEGTMSDINYDARFSRNISVDVRYILFIIDKFAGAKNIIDELKITGSSQATN